MNFSEVRAKYPQYDDMSDEALATALHSKYYSDMDFDDFSSRVGYSKPTLVEEGSDLVQDIGGAALWVAQKADEAVSGWNSGMEQAAANTYRMFTGNEGYTPEPIAEDRERFKDSTAFGVGEVVGGIAPEVAATFVNPYLGAATTFATANPDQKTLGQTVSGEEVNPNQYVQRGVSLVEDLVLGKAVETAIDGARKLTGSIGQKEIARFNDIGKQVDDFDAGKKTDEFVTVDGKKTEATVEEARDFRERVAVQRILSAKGAPTGIDVVTKDVISGKDVGKILGANKTVQAGISQKAGQILGEDLTARLGLREANADKKVYEKTLEYLTEDLDTLANLKKLHPEEVDSIQTFNSGIVEAVSTNNFKRAKELVKEWDDYVWEGVDSNDIKDLQKLSRHYKTAIKTAERASKKTVVDTSATAQLLAVGLLGAATSFPAAFAAAAGATAASKLGTMANRRRIQQIDAALANQLRPEDQAAMRTMWNMVPRAYQGEEE